MINTSLKVLILLLLVSFSSCKKRIKTEILKEIPSTIKYAKGFDIITINGSKKLLIKSAYQHSKEVFSYQIVTKNKERKIHNDLDQELLVPIDRLVAVSYTHLTLPTICSV